MEEIIELADIQGIIIKGYGKMSYAKYLLLQFKDQEKTKKWLSKLVQEVTNAATSTNDIDIAINISFTNSGISHLGISKEILNTFPREFEEGMVSKHRQRILGDFGDSDPENWDWGGTKTPTIHAALLLYAKTSEGLDKLIEKQSEAFKSNKIEVVNTLDTNKLPNNKEHFGFRDGIANPVIKNMARDEKKEHPANLINPGEFIFGYRNEYEKLPLSPNIPKELDAKNLLPELQSQDIHKERRDLGHNGSMLVFRQMQQDVVGFWKFMDKAVAEQGNSKTPPTVEHLAAKMVGRWLDGSPLTKCPFHPDEKKNTFDNFGYAEKDFDGFKCPVGAHIRRTNPRDNFLRNSTNDPKKDIEKSQKFMKRFRILRRGRAYGDPVSPTLNPHEVIATETSDKNRGLHFLCFNTSIGRQFELIQQTWVNNPKFAGLYNDPDPIIGNPEIMGEGATTTFTEQAEPIRKKVKGIPRFIEIKGGAYFFVPSIKSLQFLADL